MRLWLRTLSGLVLVVGLSGPGHAATDLSTMKPSEIDTLQKRLTDDGCYTGTIDGQPSNATSEAVKACPDQSPVLRIETGTHVAALTGLSVDAACRLLATSSNDKTIRLWALPAGQLVRTIRLPISSGNGGKVYAVALSPDGRTLAAGGWDAGLDNDNTSDLYLADVGSGTVRRIDVATLGNSITYLTFSADGNRIGIALFNKGIRVIDRDGRVLMSDQDYGNEVDGLAFAPDGSLLAASDDGFLRRYGPDLKLAVKTKIPGEGLPAYVSVDPSGRSIAVGYERPYGVSINDAVTLKLIAKGDMRGAADGLVRVAWTSDGRKIVTGGEASMKVNGRWPTFLRRFGPNGKRLGNDIAVANNTVYDLKTCASDTFFATADPLFGSIDGNGEVRVLQAPVTVDMLGKTGTALTISDDAQSVRFGLIEGEAQAVIFDVMSRTLTSSDSLPPGQHEADVSGLPVRDWDNGKPKFGKNDIQLSQFEYSNALAIRSDRGGFAIGTGLELYSFDSDGALRWQVAAPGPVHGVDLSSNGRILVAGDGDGTIRWHRWSDGKELLALFVNAKDKRWVAWTPTGYYMASPGAEDLIGWHVNRGWNQEADFFPASRFRDRFNRPDIVQRILQTLDEDEAVRQANAAAGRRDDQKPVIQSLPPVITIVSPSNGSTAAPGTVEIRYQTRTPSGGTVDRVEAFVDGAKIEARGLGPSAGAPASPDGGTILTLPMPARDAEISLVAYADGKASDAAKIELKAPAGSSMAALPGDSSLKPSLYALLIGVTHYENKAYDLAYPAQDAIGLATALKSQEGKLYRHVEVRVLTDKDATAIAVKKGLLWLQKQTTARDLAIVFAAGHGLTDPKGKFWFLTTDADPDALSISAVSKDDIADVLYDLPGKKLLFLDACHSGAALMAGTRGVEQTDLTAAVNDFAQTEGGVVAYAASTGKEFSFENEQWGHGAFTKALIEAFEGKADALHRGVVTTAMLDLYLDDRVKALTDGRQHPVMTRPKTVPDFPIASVQ